MKRLVSGSWTTPHTHCFFAERWLRLFSARIGLIGFALLASGGCSDTFGPNDQQLGPDDRLAYTLNSPLLNSAHVVVADDVAFRDAWSTFIGTDPVPEVDLSSALAFFLRAGGGPDRGYGMRVDAARFQGDTLRVWITHSEPGSLCHGQREPSTPAAAILLRVHPDHTRITVVLSERTVKGRC